MSGQSTARLQRLAGLKLFSELPAADLTLVAETGRWESFPAGQAVMRSGEEGADMLVVTSGRFAVAVGQAQSRVVLAAVGPGELLGEAVLYRRTVTRSADVVAMEESEALRLTSGDLEALTRVGNGLPRAVEEHVLTTLARRLQASRELVAGMLREEEAPAASVSLFARLKGLLGG